MRRWAVPVSLVSCVLAACAPQPVGKFEETDFSKQSIVKLMHHHAVMLSNADEQVWQLYIPEGEITVEASFASGPYGKRTLKPSHLSNEMKYQKKMNEIRRRSSLDLGNLQDWSYHLEDIRVEMHADKATVLATQVTDSNCFHFKEYHADVVDTPDGPRIASMHLRYLAAENCLELSDVAVTEKQARELLVKRTKLLNALDPRARSVYAPGVLIKRIRDSTRFPGQTYVAISDSVAYHDDKMFKLVLLSRKADRMKDRFSDVQTERVGDLIKVTARRWDLDRCYWDDQFYLLIRAYEGGPRIVEEQTRERRDARCK